MPKSYTRWDGKEITPTWPPSDKIQNTVSLLMQAVNKPAKDIDWQDVRHLIDKASDITKGYGY